MTVQAYNPYLPEDEYIPDAEPHLFGDRVYIYGSHDHFGAHMFCIGDYVCWSAPQDDLTNWRCEGVIYHKNQDPKNRSGLRLLFAPDVTQGADGRYYLYYAFDFMGIMGVAVSDSPSGPYEFYDHVHYEDGTIWGRKKGDSFPFDPGVLVDDDGSVYLYSGFYTPVPAVVTGGHSLKFEGGYVVELQSDMCTIKTHEKLLFPKQGHGSFSGHEFFEASSIRRYGDIYCFVYSSRLNHELCYATSSSPTEGFTYGGTLVSIGDIGLPGHEDEQSADNYTGNTHGGMLKLDDSYYIFYHRQTNRSSYARQACAERLDGDPQHGFAQAAITSCGLNGGPLKGVGQYSARIACNLWSTNGTGRYDGTLPKLRLRKHPYFTQEQYGGNEHTRQYIANMHNNSTAGFKYFDFSHQTSQTKAPASHPKQNDNTKTSSSRPNLITTTLRGRADGALRVSTDPHGHNTLATIDVKSDSAKEWHDVSAPFTSPDDVQPLYFTYQGEGHIDFLAFTLSQGGQA